MTSKHVRVRFAPSPTGFMHLGNVRAALMNYLFARQKNGVFILRLEDTDPQRNVDPRGKQIIEDLTWLNLTFDEGPGIGGPHEPYLQSERSGFYQEYLDKLKARDLVYPCFCTPEELETKRQRQLALKMPPRYDRHCLKRSVDERTALMKTTPYIWRFKLEDTTVQIHDMARGTITYDLKHFSDFALTRADGSFTFIFANFVDDLLMKITHIIRGEDHLTNTALQAALYVTFDIAIPVFWHLPIICNAEGKKLSKRDFGFSLTDLKSAGFMPEAIDNYLAIIGVSFKDEIMSLEELIKASNFDALASTGHIRYDLEKLRWVNHKWMMRLPKEVLAERISPNLVRAYKMAADMTPHNLKELLVNILLPTAASELHTLEDSVDVLKFYFERPVMTHQHLNKFDKKARDLVKETLATLGDSFTPESFLTTAQKSAKEQGIPIKELFWLIRFLLTGSIEGIGVKELLAMLPGQEIHNRLKAVTI